MLISSFVISFFVIYFIIFLVKGGQIFGNKVKEWAAEPISQNNAKDSSEQLFCKPGEQVYGEVEVKRYSDYNGGTDIRMDEKGELYLVVYNLKTGERHRLSDSYLIDLEDKMDATFKAMAENEKNFGVAESK